MPLTINPIPNKRGGAIHNVRPWESVQADSAVQSTTRVIIHQCVKCIANYRCRACIDLNGFEFIVANTIPGDEAISYLLKPNKTIWRNPVIISAVYQICQRHRRRGIGICCGNQPVGVVRVLQDG